jgi:hypothetical protein
MDKNFEVKAKFCKNGDLKNCDAKEINGTWNLLERSMLHVELENNQRFVTAMRYEISPEIANDPLKIKAKELQKKIKLWQRKHT